MAELAEQTAPSPAEVSAEKLEKYVHEAKLAALEESTQTEAYGTPDPKPDAAPAGAGKPQRGPGGKFLPKGEKAAAGASNAGGEAVDTAAPPKDKVPEKKAEDKPADKAAESATIARARRLFEEGKFDEASKLVFGKPFDELELKSKHWADWRHQNKTVSQKLEADRQRFQQEYAQAQEMFRPIVAAKQALDAGDYEGFVKHATGLDPNEFSKRMLASFHKGAVALPPAVSQQLTAIQRELEETKRARAELEKQAAERSKVETINNYKNSIWQELTASEDDRFKRAANKAPFVNRIFEIQAQHYDHATKETMPLDEAAEIAWGELYDFGDGGAQTAGTKTDRAEKPVRPAARPPTTLKQNGAAEASGAGPKLKGDALLAAYVKKAEMEALRESTGAGAS